MFRYPPRCLSSLYCLGSGLRGLTGCFIVVPFFFFISAFTDARVRHVAVLGGSEDLLHLPTLGKLVYEFVHVSSLPGQRSCDLFDAVTAN